jgi:hypothetical protein
MTVRLGFAEGPGRAGAAAAELDAFLGRLVRWDKAAVVRLRSAEGEPALGVFGHPPFGGVLAVKSMALRGATRPSRRGICWKRWPGSGLGPGPGSRWAASSPCRGR